MDSEDNIIPTLSFRYKHVYEKGKPVHNKTDSFTLKHPPMDLGRRAKIFSPFDALKGFSEELIRTETENEDTYTNYEFEPIEEFP